MINLPKHIAIIMDGNGRWAVRKKLPRVAGHHKGVEALRAIIKHSVERQIQVITLFAFSSENWQRPPLEVNLLMTLMQKLLIEEVDQLHANNIKLRVIGNITPLASVLRAAINNAEMTTKNNTGLQLNIAINYGGRWDIVQAARALCVQAQAGEINPTDISEAMFNQYMMLTNIPEPDLLIRTSGEQRLSNFLLWQLAYTEIYFSPVLWPDFTPKDLDAALYFYQHRERRFGGVEENLSQVEHA